jgi:hypothetical protein
MAWLIAPVLLLLGLSDLIGLLPISRTAAGVGTMVTIGLFVPLGLPWMIRHLFKTDPLDAATDVWVKQLLSSAGVSRTRSVRWNTGRQSFNAMVAGFVPPLRTLLLSDRLLDELPKSQIAMVVLHEAAHLRPPPRSDANGRDRAGLVRRCVDLASRRRSFVGHDGGQRGRHRIDHGDSALGRVPDRV